MVVESVGSPRDGKQVATLGSQEDHAPLRLAASLPAYPAVEPGTVVEVAGRTRPRPDSGYGRYLARIGAWGSLDARVVRVMPGPDDPGRTLERVRRGAGDALAAVLPEPEAGLAAGILIGLRDRVDRDLAAAFTTAGVSHVVAISGWNIAIVAAAVGALAGRLGRRRRSVVTILAIATYALFAGASASVLRAAVMSRAACAGDGPRRARCGRARLGGGHPADRRPELDR
jgi:competence protein ComEC